MSWRVCLAVVAFLAAWLSLSALAAERPVDLVLVNGNVFTADPENPSAEAIAIRGDRIAAVGTSEEIERLAGVGTRRIDLERRTVVPGFNDAHFHFDPDPKGFQLRFQSLEPSWEGARAAIREAVRQAPRGTWIFGVVGREIVLDPNVTRFALDRIAPNHPVLLRAYYGHGYIVSSKAMPPLGIAETERDPAGGRYERVAGSTRINGRLWEYAEWKPNRTLVGRVTDEEAVRALQAMAGQAVRYGVTSMQVMPSMSVDRFARLLVRSDLPIRVRAMPFPITTPRGRDLSEISRLSELRSPTSRVTVSGIKWVLDGTPIERGAALRRPYDDRPGWSGRLNFPEDEIGAIVRESLHFDQPLLVHCAGDRAAEAVFQAMEKAGSGVDWPSKRLRIEHGDGVVGDLIPRALKLGVLIVQNPSHFTDPPLFHARWGTEMQPLRSLIEAGIPVAIGSDGPINPFLNILFAATHPNHPAEAITREQAVRAYTLGSAFAEFAEKEKGTVAPGKLADVAVLSRNVFSEPLPALPEIRSVLTIVGGQIVYDADALK